MREVHIQKLAKAIESAVSEHGTPNGFRCWELCRLYGGPHWLIAGKIGKWYLKELAARLELVGVDTIGLSYKDGAFLFNWTEADHKKL